MKRTPSRTKTTLFIFLAAAICIIPGTPDVLFSDGPGPRTIARDLLELEKEFGAGESHSAYIDRFLDMARKSVKGHVKYSTDAQALETLRSIDSLIKSEGFSFRPNYLLSAGIDSKKIDCDNYSALYISVAEVLRLPIVPVNAPNHSFVRLVFEDGSYLNWEPLEGKPLPNEFYIQRFGIAKSSVERGVFLKSLNRTEFLGVQYNTLGSYLFSRKKFSDSIPYFSMAIRLNPLLSSAYHNRGSAYYATKRNDHALADLTKAADLDPNRASTQNTLGDIYFDKKEYDTAARHYRAAITFDPTSAAPYHNWGLILKLQGKDDIAKKLLDKAAEIRKQYPQ